MGLGNTRPSTPWVGLGGVKAPSPYPYYSSGSAQGALPQSRRPRQRLIHLRPAYCHQQLSGCFLDGLASASCLCTPSLSSASYPFLSTYVILFHRPLSLQTDSFTYISCQASDRLPHPLITFPSTDRGAGLPPGPQLLYSRIEWVWSLPQALPGGFPTVRQSRWTQRDFILGLYSVTTL